ncbi:MAG: LuxR C-terminal-related transcriptional regulator [Prevotellaceae bacterium]|jgi:DNA-binding NarL/FixJ family response regulator|nr:LuxR C-terminal-related transcriptional regulator [Prevotellaceae bacterium]
MLNTKQQYVNTISRQQIIEKDRNGKTWIIMGIMDISPDQALAEKVKRVIVNRKTKEIIVPAFTATDRQLTNREKEILTLIYQGFLNKEIAYKLAISTHTVNNHRKNILAKLGANSPIEAITFAQRLGLLS